MNKIIMAAITICTLTGCCNKEQLSKTEVVKQKIDSLFNSRYKIGEDVSKNNSPGASVLITKGDTILYNNNFGIANYTNDSLINNNTFFNIASVSKQFTAVAILKLHSKGLLDINKSIYDVHPEVNKYLPERRKPFTDIKVKHLMDHSSGIMDTRPRENRDWCVHATDMESIQYIKGIKELAFAPGTDYQYMNPTFQLLYLMIENVSGKPFEQYMKEEIFTPAGMDQTIYFQAGREIPNMSHAYIPEANGWKEYDYGEETFFATKADGGIYTSVNEFAKWEKAMSDNKIIPVELKELAYSPINKISGSKFSSYQNRPNTSYGYGWFIDETPNIPRKIYHTGDNGGFQIYAAKYPDKEVQIMIFENRNDNSRWDMAKEIDRILYEEGIL